ncbi:thiol:disulfide interchange protein DsbG [Comamonas sp. Y6]|uniref:Thiol:disulfide interchange protein n=1 Tax=Comamonas resistens TaxID=3046670 RepID=A0ABY8SQQ8_9BURK|nr:thiol:disulfide interchange protein DsbG [Comamonas resistens]MDL5035862.1 thiol:disulfide interchange protein DsbG [Comamonas resistens]WHS65268.1 thiol:disulfide interchange protein DsbG [Comamonas resistens]HBP0978940.1 thiol:disulfide interchange protein DsbG [Pseudomonas aeruginosa]
MFAQRSHIHFLLAASLMLVTGCSQAESADKPPALKALEDQGLTVTQEFKVGGGLRAFAAVAGDRPIAVYITSDGNAIMGTRLNAKGEPMDEADLEKLAAKPVSDKEWSQLQASTWVLDGKKDAPRVIYTFSDANCPYCHRFWEASRPWVDSGKVQLRHILVGIIKEDSPAKAAAILGAPDQTAALVMNEQRYGQGGITPVKSVPADVSKILDDNLALMMNTGFRGTPGIVVRGPNGVLKKYNGMPQGAQLGEVLGPR